MPTASKKLGQDILFMRYKQLQNVPTIATTLGVSEEVVRSCIDEDMSKRIALFKETSKTSKSYSARKIDTINFLRNEQQKSCEEIAELLGLSQNVVYSAINSKSTKSSKSTHKVALTRDEKRKRNEEILRLNVEEGMTLEAIGKQFNLTKQRISDILREMGHIPLTGNKIKAMDQNKNKSILAKKSVDTYNNKLEELGSEVRIAKQKLSIYKYYAARQFTELRCELMQCILDNWEHNKPLSQYKGLAKTLRAGLSHLINNGDESSLEYQMLKGIVSKCDELEKKYNI